FALLSDWFVKLIRWLIGRVRALIRLLLRLGDLFIVRPAIALYRLIIVILGFLTALSIFLGRLVLQLLYPLWRITLWLIRPLGQGLYRLVRGEAWLAPAYRYTAAIVRRIAWFRTRK